MAGHWTYPFPLNQRQPGVFNSPKYSLMWTRLLNRYTNVDLIFVDLRALACLCTIADRIPQYLEESTICPVAMRLYVGIQVDFLLWL